MVSVEEGEWKEGRGGGKGGEEEARGGRKEERGRGKEGKMRDPGEALMVYDVEDPA